MPEFLKTVGAARFGVMAGVAAVLTAGVVAGIRGVSLPFDGSDAPLVRIAAATDPFSVAGALWSALLSRPALAVETIVLAVVAAALPYARSRGLWAVAALGAGFLAAASAHSPPRALHADGATSRCASSRPSKARSGSAVPTHCGSSLRPTAR